MTKESLLTGNQLLQKIDFIEADLNSLNPENVCQLGFRNKDGWDNFTVTSFDLLVKDGLFKIIIALLESHRDRLKKEFELL